MKIEKREPMKEIEIQNKESIRTLGKMENYKYMRIDKPEIKEKVRNEYLRKTRKLVETRLSNRNHIKVIHTWEVSIVIYIHINTYI